MPTLGDLLAQTALSDPFVPRWEARERPAVPGTALDAARELDDTSGARRATPVRKIFVRSDGEDAPPLSNLVRVGGRGGAVAIKLYIALIWRCSGWPYQTSLPGRFWATLLGLEDPEVKGVRRIADALKRLQAAGLIRVEYSPGHGNTILLLDESGDGSEYQLPSNQWSRAPKGAAGDQQRRRNTYFKIASEWWTEGDIQGLSSPALTMLLILLAEQAGDGKEIWFATDTFPARYRVSQKVRSVGTKELLARRLLDIDRQALPERPGSTASRRRYRNIYKLVNPTTADN